MRSTNDIIRRMEVTVGAGGSDLRVVGGELVEEIRCAPAVDELG